MLNNYFFVNFQILCFRLVVQTVHQIQHLYYNSPYISVGVRKLQVAILARSSREMSLTVRIV